MSKKQSEASVEKMKEAARIAEIQHPDWHFILCGNGKDEARFRAETAELANIELVGWVDNVGDYLAAFDVFAYPSLHEALGSVLLDAMQQGLPIVASRVGGIPEFIRDGVNGVLFDAGNSIELVSALVSVLDDPEIIARMEKNNRLRAADYSASTMACDYLRLYSS